MKKILLSFLILFLLAYNLHAQPSPSSISGTLVDGNSFTVSGTSFGSNSSPEPKEFTDFEGGTDGNLVAESYWEEKGSGCSAPVYDQDNSWGNSGMSSWHCSNNGDGSSSLMVVDTSDTDWFVSWWMYEDRDYTGGSEKTLRLTGPLGNDNYGPAIYISGQNNNWTYITPQNSSGNAACDDGTVNYDDPQRRWARYDVWFTQYGNDFEVVIYDANDGTPSKDSYTSTNCDFGSSKDAEKINLGQTFNTGGEAWFDNVVHHSTPARVELCDNQTWSSATHCEYQYATAWSTTEITFTVKRFGFGASETVYLHVCDSSNSCSSSGLEATFGTTYPTGSTSITGVKITSGN